jgi:hypothetical protein
MPLGQLEREHLLFSVDHPHADTPALVVPRTVELLPTDNDSSPQYMLL